MSKSYIKSRFTFEGIHNWGNAPDEAYYLRSEHRHLFHVICTKEVFHDDRDVEFINFAREVKTYLETVLYPERKADCVYLGQQSCEMIAKKLLDKYDLFECEVWEDMENGGLVTKG